MEEKPENNSSFKKLSPCINNMFDLQNPDSWPVFFSSKIGKGLETVGTYTIDGGFVHRDYYTLDVLVDENMNAGTSKIEKQIQRMAWWEKGYPYFSLAMSEYLSKRHLNKLPEDVVIYRKSNHHIQVFDTSNMEHISTIKDLKPDTFNLVKLPHIRVDSKEGVAYIPIEYAPLISSFGTYYDYMFVSLSWDLYLESSFATLNGDLRFVQHKGKLGKAFQEALASEKDFLMYVTQRMGFSSTRTNPDNYFTEVIGKLVMGQMQ